MSRNLTEETLARKIKVVKPAEDYQNTLERFEKRKADEKAAKDKEAKANAKKKAEDAAAKRAAEQKAREGKYQPFANLKDILKTS